MITLQIDINEVNLILAALGKMPYEAVYQIIPKLQGQAQASLKPPPSDVPSQQSLKRK